MSIEDEFGLVYLGKHSKKIEQPAVVPPRPVLKEVGPQFVENLEVVGEDLPSNNIPACCWDCRYFNTCETLTQTQSYKEI